MVATRVLATRMVRMQLMTLVAALLAGCQLSIPAPASAGTTRMTRTELMFGRSIPGGGSVSDAEWQAFVDEMITPRFPAGFSVVDALGQYREASGTIAHERSKILLLFHDGSAESVRKLDEIRADYKKRFKQESVLRESGESWVTF